jgi:hypothetical protein
MTQNNIQYWYSGLLCVLLTFESPANCAAQTTNWLIPKTSITNSIPANVFLTDDDKLFWFNSSRQRVIHSRAITEAESLPESRPAAQDPEGNWGTATNGLQLSLRFDKQFFTNGEQIVANLLLRNVTNVPVKFERFYVSHRPSPINVLVSSDQKQLSKKGDNSEINVISSTEITIYPQTQRKFSVRLNDYYDLTVGGDFIVQAVYDNEGKIASQKVHIQVK